MTNSSDSENFLQRHRHIFDMLFSHANFLVSSSVAHGPWRRPVEVVVHPAAASPVGALVLRQPGHVVAGGAVAVEAAGSAWSRTGVVYASILTDPIPGNEILHFIDPSLSQETFFAPPPFFLRKKSPWWR